MKKLRQNFNVARESIIKLINFSFINLNLDELKDETIAYGLRNYISKYSLSKETHLISEKAYNLIDNSNEIHRSHKKKLKIKFEHTVPSKVIYETLLDLKHKNQYSIEKLIDLLNLTDIVTIITKEENDLLDKKVDDICLRGKMFKEEKLNKQNIFSRYKKSKIKLAINENGDFIKINMIGAIYR